MKLFLLAIMPGLSFGAISIVNSALPNPIMATAVSGSVWAITATGGTGPYTYAITSGSIPTGLSLSSGGVLTGTATAAGSYTFTVRATDSLAATGSASFTVLAQYAVGHGCTTVTVSDWDCDYYGPGSAIGPDADDNDATVNTAASMISKYGTLANFLSTVKGYAPSNIWYISPSGNDSTCVVNSSSSPCASFYKVANSMSAGDMMLFRAGTYYQEDAHSAYANYDMPSGNSTHQNYAMAYPGEKAILDHRAGATVWYGIEVTTYATIDGLVIQNTPCAGPPGTTSCSGSGGIGLNFSSTAQVTNMTVRNCELKDWYRGIWGISSQANTLIERNVIHDCYGEHNIYLGNNSGSAAPQVSVVTARNNLLYNASWDNFHFNGICTGCLLDGNIMYSANMTAGGGSTNIALQNGWNSSTIQNNIVFNASAIVIGIQDYFDTSLCCVPAPANNNTIVNNTFVFTGRDASGQDLSNSSFGVAMTINQAIPTWTASTIYPALAVVLDPSGHAQFSTAGGTSGGTTPTWNDSGGTTTDGGVTWIDKGSQIKDMGHNTFANNALVDLASPGSSNSVVQFWRQSSLDTDWLTTDTFTNNLIYSLQGGPLADGIVLQNAVPTPRNQAYFTANAGTYTGNVQSAPAFKASNVSWYATPSLWNLRPGAGSPLIAAGTHTGAPTTDITGATRANPPYIGAYDIQAVVASLIPATSSQNVVFSGKASVQ